jgi:hypothetical protein
MTTIARRFDDGVRKQRDVDKTMGTAQPPGWIQRCRCQVDARTNIVCDGLASLKLEKKYIYYY